MGAGENRVRHPDFLPPIRKRYRGICQKTGGKQGHGGRHREAKDWVRCPIQGNSHEKTETPNPDRRYANGPRFDLQQEAWYWPQPPPTRMTHPPTKKPQPCEPRSASWALPQHEASPKRTFLKHSCPGWNPPSVSVCWPLRPSMLPGWTPWPPSCRKNALFFSGPKNQRRL